MITPELIRRYPFFSGLDFEPITTLAMIADEYSVDPGHFFFHEGEKLDKLYFVLEGKVEITVSVPDRDHVQDIAEQIVGNFITEDVTVSTVGSGQLFAWSALIPPHVSTASARVAVPSRVLAFESEDLFNIFKKDCEFGNLMLLKVASVIRQRLRDMRIQSLAFTIA